MTSDQEIFAAVVDLTPEERRAYLARACGDDHAQRVRLGELLAAHECAQGFMRGPAASSPLGLAEKPGDVLGRYKLLQRIGEGGVGVVWMAQQDQPLRRQVALKVIKRGMDTDAVVARFEVEREALARMEHPNIARVFDAGVTNNGRPFFVMELVRGAPITTYCDEHHFTTAQRLELFIAVCHALEHAHQKGVIHRDLKPSNILVTENGGVAQPKVIDFGIAKATQGQLGERTVFTAFEQFIGTPTYMSPEQAGMGTLDLDTRSDLYSLGVLLFELLTGHTPFDKATFLQGGIDQIRQRIREGDPARPSARLKGLEETTRTTVARQRATRVEQLAVELRGDLDWIVMRCLEKDRTRRYQTASALAQDLGRFLRHEPVSARPPSTWYVLGKLVARHRGTVVAAALVAAVIVVGGTVSAWQAIRATRAEREQGRLRAVESQLRRHAEFQEQVARRRAYAADMNLAQQALANENLGLAKRLLLRQRPAGEQPDLRGWEWRYLWQLTRSEAEAALATRPHPVASLSVSSDGNWLAIGQADGGQLSVLNLRSRQELALPAGVGTVRAVFSPVAPLLAIAFTHPREAPSRHGVRLWDLSSRQTVAEWESAFMPGEMYFSGDGATLVLTGGGRSSEVAEWRVPTGERLESFAAGGFGSVAISRDLRWLARAGSRRELAPLELVDARSGSVIWRAELARENVSALAFSPDGAVLAMAAGNTASDITLWDVRTGRMLGNLEGHRTYVAGLMFWPDGRTLASAGTDQTIRIWDIEARALRRTLRGHELEVHSLALFPDLTTLVSGAKDGTVLLWDTASPERLRQMVIEGVAAWRFESDRESVIIVGNDGTIRRHHGASFARSEWLFSLETRTNAPTARVSLAARAPLVAAPVGDGRVRILDWQAKQMKGEFATGGRDVIVVGFARGDATVLLAYDGETPGSHAVHEWEIATQRRLRSWRAVRGSGPQTGANTDGRWLALRGPDSSLTLIDLETGVERRLPPSGATRMPAFSPDQRVAAVGSTAGWVRILDVASGRQLEELTGFVLGVHSTQFSSDGRRLITGSGGAEAVRVWDAVSFEPLLTLSAEGSIFSSALISSDGAVLGARNLQGQLYLWRAPSWEQIPGVGHAPASDRRP